MGVYRRARLALVAFVSVVLVSSGRALAHGGGLANAQPERLTVPTWLFLTTGGGVIGASFLLTTFATDREFLKYLHSRRRALPTHESVLRWGGRVLGLGGLLMILLAGYLGPPEALQNAAILLVWAGWWAGYTMTVYLGGTSWPAINPFRTLATVLGEGRVEYPRWLAGWPSVVGLLALIWIEIVSPLADDPRLLAGFVSLYLVVTLVGAFLFGAETWFANVDPISNVFRQYGKVAPVQRRRSGLALTIPGSALIRNPAVDRADVGLIIALVWGTTYDGFVQTPLWVDLAVPLVEAGIPPMLLYPAVLFAGFFVFWGVYRLACRYVRTFAPTYRDTTRIARLFAPSLLAIAAGYHLAHYLSYFLTLSPALLSAFTNVLQPSTPVSLVLPGWFAGLSIAFVLLGHILAIWVAHSIAYEHFPSKIQAIRSQYTITLVMVFYTMLSLWIVTQPYSTPPYL